MITKRQALGLLAGFTFSIGVYLTSTLGSLIALRTSQSYTFLFKLLEAVGALWPYVSGPLLLTFGIATLFGAGTDKRWRFVKIMLALSISVLPLIIHLSMFQWTYYPGPPPPRIMWGPLSIGEWGAFTGGLFLTGCSILLFVRSRRT